jgi:hypothetical protein
VFPEKSLQNPRPPAAVVAAWSQLAVAALVVVLVVVNAFGMQLIIGAQFGDSPVSPLQAGPPLALAAWLAITAVGLLRRSRVAYRLSLAGLALPLLIGTGATLLGVGARYESTFTGVMLREDQDAATLAARLNTWAMVSTAVNGAAALAALALAVLTLGLLLTRPTRHFFAPPVGDVR